MTQLSNTGTETGSHTGVATGPTTDAAKDTSFFGHPRGLAVLFFAEMWERFSYYGMRALLIFYVTQHFLFTDAFGSSIYGTYASMVYLMPVLGGFLADRYLGQKKAVMFGAILLVLGHLSMAFEGPPATQQLMIGGEAYDIAFSGRGDDRISFVTLDDRRHLICAAKTGLALVPDESACPRGSDDATPVYPPETRFLTKANSTAPDHSHTEDSYQVTTERNGFYVGVFYFALSLIIMGVGFLKANISSVVGSLYAEQDPRRDRGFTIFYMGINIGSVAATLLCGYLGQTFGWAYGFGAAGIGMAFGLVVFAGGQKHLVGHGEPPQPTVLKAPLVAGLNRERLIYVGGLVGILPVWLLIQHATIVQGSLVGVTVISIAGVILFSFGIEKFERERLFTALALIMFSVIFWMLFEQAGSSLNLYAQRNSSLSVFGLFEMQASQTQFFNPALIVLCAPLFSMLWGRLARAGREPSTPVKFALGLLQVGLGFLVLVFGAQFADSNAQVALIWLVLAYLLHSTGELCLSPVGLSMITKLSVSRIVSLMMGIWFLSSSIAHSLAGVIAASTATETVGGQTLDKQAQLATYVDVFTGIGLLGVGTGVLVLLLNPLLKKGMHGVH